MAFLSKKKGKRRADVRCQWGGKGFEKKAIKAAKGSVLSALAVSTIAVPLAYGSGALSAPSAFAQTQDSSSVVSDAIPTVSSDGKPSNPILDENLTSVRIPTAIIDESSKDDFVHGVDIPGKMKVIPKPEPKPEPTEKRESKKSTSRDSDRKESAESNKKASGGYINPGSGYPMTSGYGYRIHPTLGYNKMHEGVDYGIPCGTATPAANSGTVVEVGYGGASGMKVVIDHGDGISTAYYHLQSFAVSSGQKVKKGQSVGQIGSTGRSTGCHLHFGAMKTATGEWFNPTSLY